VLLEVSPDDNVVAGMDVIVDVDGIK